MKKVLILGANGRIARIVEERLLKEQPDVALTLFLRNANRLNNLATNDRVTLVDGDVTNAKDVEIAMKGQDIVYVAMVDHDADNKITKNVINAMKDNGVKRVISSNILGIYDEVPGAFGQWNKEQVSWGLRAAINADKALADSGLDYTTIRIPWLNDRDEVKYTVTHKGAEYLGVSGSRQSVADVIVKMIADPSYLAKDSIGLADPDTQGLDLQSTKFKEEFVMVKVNLISGKTTINLAIDNGSQTAKDFLAALPLSLTMTNYDDREFYSVIKPLSEDGPVIPTFTNGDVTYYTTGQSLAIFFGKDDQSRQADLIKIGRVSSDLSKFRDLGLSAEVTLKLAA